MKKVFKKILLVILLLVLFFAGYLFLGSAEPAEEIIWGVNFSHKHARDMGLDWQEAYLALLEDLNVKNIKVTAHWDLIEPEDGNFDFEDLDWQIREAEEKGAEILLVVGMKTGRWPECHIPEWAWELNKEEQQQKILRMLEEVVLRYRDSDAVWGWQVENEPFFPFGICPWTDKEFLKKEIELVKFLDDSQRPVVITDSGEFSFWIKTARLGDIVGTTLHRRVWFREIKSYITYPLRPVFYWRRAQIIRNFFNKEVIVGELQAEPWGPKLLYDSPLEEQEKTMNLEQFRRNIEFAENTGLPGFYLWGAEWWYWMKEKQNDPAIWNEAKKLFK